MSKKRLISAFLAGVLALSSLSALSSCNKTKDEGPAKTKRTNVYRGTNIALPDDINYIRSMAVGGDKVYITYEKEVERQYDPNDKNAAVGYATAPVVEETIAEDGSVSEVEPEVYYDYITCVYCTSFDGTETYECELEKTGNSYINSMSVDNEGNLWILEQEWWNNEDYTESGTYYRIYQVDMKTGAKGIVVDLNAAIEASGMAQDYYYVNQFFMGNDGLIHISLENGIISCDNTGNFVGKSEITDGWISSIMVSGEDVYVSVYPNNGTRQLMQYDLTAGTFTQVESQVLNNAMDTYYNFGGIHPAGKLYLRNSTGISVYDFTTDTITELMNYINCDIDSSNMNNVVYLNDGRILSSYTDWSGEKAVSCCTIYERIPDEEMQEEVIINLACTYTSYYLRKTIIKFNKRNTGVRISVTDYSSYNNEENEWTGAVTQLNNDIVTGKVPDILVLNSELPVESYFQKNLFTDLNPYLDGENGLDRSTLLDNILRACETNGKLNSIITSFTLNTLTAKSSYVGTEPGWTLEEMMETIRKMPEGMSAFFEYSRDNIMENLFRYSMDSFIDWDTGETYFNTQGFIDLIEFLKTAPEKDYWSAYYDSIEGNEYNPEAEKEMQENYGLRFYKDMALFSMTYIGDFRAYLNEVQAFGSEDITMVGYPTRDENSNGATIVPEMELAICSASKCKDEAWTFLKYLLTDEDYLNSMYAFTLNKSKLEEMYRKTEEDNEYFYEMTEDDYQWYYENYSEDYVNFLKNSQRKYTSSDGEKIMKILEGAVRVFRTDNNVLNIVKEELSSFFGGTKSAADAADIINSRVRIYVSENS